jgi:hypothetical protein
VIVPPGLNMTTPGPWWVGRRVVTVARCVVDFQPSASPTGKVAIVMTEQPEQPGPEQRLEIQIPPEIEAGVHADFVHLW